MNSLQKKALWRVPQGEGEKLYILEDYSVTPGIAFQASTVSLALRSSTI